VGVVRPAVLAVDGGNSKTDVALVAATGEVLAHVRGPGSSPHHLGVDRAVELLDDLVRKALAHAGLAATDTVADVAGVYLAGVDLPAELTAVTDAVAPRRWAPDVVVDNDTFALLRAGTDAPDAVAVVCGAGINCVGVAADGRHARFAALGRLSGDWGGGQELGDEALWAAARAVDGRGPHTALAVAVPEFFDLPDVPAVYEAIHFRRLPETRLMELAPVVLRVARVDGDPVAVSIVRRLAEEVGALVRAALRRLGLLDNAAAVVLGGGVLTSSDPLLIGLVRDEIAAFAPRARVGVTTAPPVVGAALLGLDRVGAPDDAHRRLRGSLRLPDPAL
jgi:N-acetylglucosamine kinase-like BadF-type ATPase